MRSRAERLRILLERSARGSLVAILALLAYRELRARPELTPERASSAELTLALERWTRRAPAAAIVSFDVPPSPVERAWLAALIRAGTPVQWQAAGMQPLAITVDRPPGPDERVRVSVAAPERALVILGDASGIIDTLLPQGGGAAMTLPAVWGNATVSSGRWRAAAGAVEHRAPGRVLVVGSAGWEAKFILAALEEAGWDVEASLFLRPGAVVTQGNPPAPDTARHAAVIVLDSVSAALGARVAAFVRSGGGAVIGPDAWNVPAFHVLLPGSAGPSIPARPGATRHTLATLGTRTLAPVSHASVLARRGPEAVVAARRIESGRVLQLGYEESWRWRMTGADGSVEAHREWWTRMIAAVAYQPFRGSQIVRGVEPGGPDRGQEDHADGAPLARLTAALGPASPETGDRVQSTATSAALLALSFLILLGEIASRRLRGAR